MKKYYLMIVVATALWALPMQAQARTAVGQNALSGGFGFQVGMTDWTPGGFKWFNDYSRELSKLVWLNFQVNVTLGDLDDGHCWYDNRDHRRCDYDHWDGNAIDFVIGVKLKWDVSKFPIQLQAKLGGAVGLLLLGSDYMGIGLGFRGGFGAHYFFLPNLGVGAEINFTLGPSIIADGPGVELYGVFDVQVIGVEFRF